MSNGKSNANDTAPIAESTQIEDSPTPSPSRSKFLWGGKYTFRRNKMSPAQQQSSPNATQKTVSVQRPKALDAKVFRDIQSTGFASRIVKYGETSEPKSRPIANRTYNRPGDFPIVNLEKNEISIKPRPTNGSTIAKIGVGAPLRLNNQASIRSTIFRTGKNYGDTTPIATNNSGASIAGTSSNGNGPSTSRDDEPIVAISSDYEPNPTRSVLDALVEISRKRTACDDLDGEFMKKQKPERSPTTSAQSIRQPSPPPNQITKRARDRLSPSYHNNAAETQKKRYRNNDILSSLSSSMHMNALKSARANLDGDVDGEKSNTNTALDKNAVKSRPALRNECTEGNGIDEAAMSSAPQNNLPNEMILTKPSTTLPRDQSSSKIQKLTLFNKIYEPTATVTSSDDCAADKNDLDESASADYEDNRISFVKPKAKTSTVFKVDKDRTGAKSKLAIMLSFLSDGGESRDEIDNGVNAEKTKANELVTNTAVASNLASLSGSEKTTVTFSTATTTSVLSLPSNVTGIEAQKSGDSIVAASDASTAKIDAVKSTVAATIPTSVQSNALPKIVAVSATSEQPKPTISFALNPTTTAISPSLSSTATVSAASEYVPRLGGFSFAATLTTPSAAAIAANSETNLNDSLATKRSENEIVATQSSASAMSASTALPTFSFGKTSTPTIASTAAATAVESLKSTPAAGGFSFGATTAPKNPQLTFGVIASTSATASAVATTSTQSMPSFSFAKNLNGPAVAAPSNAMPSFAAPSFGTPTTLQSFNFTPTKTTTTASPLSIIPTTTSSASIPAPTFNFAAKPSGITFGAPATTPAPPGGTFSFGTATAPVAPANSTPNLFGASNTNNTTVPVFGAKNGNTNSSTVTSQAAAPNLFGMPTAMPTTTKAAAVASIPTFGASNTSFNSIATTTVPSFGGSFNRSSTTTTAAPPAFGASTTTTFNSPASAPVFGAFGSNTNGTPAFGSAVAFGAPAVTTASQTPTTNLFGSSTVAAAQKSEPVFGNNSTAAAFATPSFGGASNNVFGSTAQTQNKVVGGGAGGGSILFGSSNNTNNAPSFGATPTFGSIPTSSFGSTAAPAVQSTATNGVFAFGQAAAPTTTASTGGGGGGIFGNTSTNTNSSFTFGQQTPTVPANSTFGAQTNATNAHQFAFNAGASNSNNTVASTAPPTFGGSSSGFNFTPSPFGAPAPSAPIETKSAFSFNTVPTANATSVAAFGSAPANVSPFGNNGTPVAAPNSGFGFGANTNEATKPFSFGSATVDNSNSSNMFGAPNAFQFNAQQPPTTNLFSIGPGNSSNASKNRPIRQATRRINK